MPVVHSHGVGSGLRREVAASRQQRYCCQRNKFDNHAANLDEGISNDARVASLHLR